MAGQLNTYSQEIFNFLRTVTIKFTPFAYDMGEAYMTAHGLTSPDFEENPYYQRLMGNYCDGDTRMMVTTLEDGLVVEYNRELVTAYPQTAALYRIPNKEYFTLEELYPDNVGLIRTIAYPVQDIQAAMAAPNLSLLAYDDSLLELNEREDIINCLKDFLDMVRKRWWIDAYVYEELYPTTFWAMLWQHLPLLLLSRRFQNIKTPYVHSYHIWEYLQSKGLKDYRDVLTTRQANWLYRNIDYVHANRGKNETLKILAENLLPDVAVSLLYKDMYQETETRYEDELSTNPIFRSYRLTDDEHVKDESFTELNDKLVALGVEQRKDLEYTNEQELLLARHKYNILGTKFLEFKKEPVDTRNERLMINFFLDTLFYRYSQGKLLYTCKFRDPYTTSEFEFSIADTILIWHYALWKAQGVTPHTIPTKAVCWIPFTLNYPLLSDLTPYIYSNQSKYYMDTVVNREEIRSLIPWSDMAYADSMDYMTNVVQQLAALLKIREQAFQSNRKEYHDALMVYLADIRASSVVDLKLTPATTFSAWSQGEEIAPLLEAYEHLEDPEDMQLHYGKLAKSCFDALCPTSGINMEGFIGSTTNMETVYRTIRDLFIQLGSYDVFYLETDRDRNEYLTFYEPDISFPLRLDMTMWHVFDWTHENYKIDVDYIVDPSLPDLNADMVVGNIIPQVTLDGTLCHDANIDQIKITFNPKLSCQAGLDITHIQFNWSCDIVQLLSDERDFSLQEQ